VSELCTLLAGLVFGESPRWHGGRLYAFDLDTDEVFALDPAGP
jgi:hypothetical protein